MVQKIRSKYSGVLEINYVNGKKVLDSKNTSYSYGNLQKVWDKVLQKIQMTGEERTLILGMGAGSSIALLREKYKHTGKIVAIELDPVIIEIADTEFGIRPGKDLQIECMDAAEYVIRKTRKFELILIDLFIDDKVPGKFLSREFWKAIAGKTAEKGKIIFNAFEDENKLAVIREELESAGLAVQFFPKINGSNMMVYGERKSNDERNS